MNNEYGHWLNCIRHTTDTRSPNEKTMALASGAMLWHIPRVKISQQWLWPLRWSSGTAQKNNNRLLWGRAAYRMGSSGTIGQHGEEALELILWCHMALEWVIQTGWNWKRPSSLIALSDWVKKASQHQIEFQVWPFVIQVVFFFFLSIYMLCESGNKLQPLCS